MTPDEFFRRERSLAFLMGAMPQQGNFGWGAVPPRAPPKANTSSTVRAGQVIPPARVVSMPSAPVHVYTPPAHTSVSAPTAPGVHPAMPSAPTAPGVHTGMPSAPTGVHTGMPSAPTASIARPAAPGAPVYTPYGIVGRPAAPGAPSSAHPYIAPPSAIQSPSGNYGQRHWWHHQQEQAMQAAQAAAAQGGGGAAPPPPPPPSQDYGQPAPYDDGSGYAQPAPPPPPGALDSSGMPVMTPYDYAAMQMPTDAPDYTPSALPDDGSSDSSGDGSDDGSDVGYDYGRYGYGDDMDGMLTHQMSLVQPQSGIVRLRDRYADINQSRAYLQMAEDVGYGGISLPHWAIPAAAGAAGYALYRKYRVGGFG